MSSEVIHAERVIFGQEGHDVGVSSASHRPDPSGAGSACRTTTSSAADRPCRHRHPTATPCRPDVRNLYSDSIDPFGPNEYAIAQALAAQISVAVAAHREIRAAASP